MPKQDRIGGTFAPALSDEKLSEYRSMTSGLEASPVKDAMNTLLKCCEHWWNLPDSAGTAMRDHPSGVGVIVPLEKDIAGKLWDEIPWEHEMKSIQELLDTIDPTTARDLRNAAFHLLWHVKELDLDREPLTSDKL